ncbi:TolC family protein [Mangrovimicrobium sediminis]|uniref:TolC family protein n=1 Tax=Mangrovimicrobium sediminis TaxID=2562682 RepID=A0A4Z0M088_9GAMM|nr:TolC family protein [Haliea sp. SAOS-164]
MPALLAALASACAPLGPDFQEPEPAWLANWQPDLYGQTEQVAGADLSQWWQRFHDPLLDELVATARRENPSLRIAGLRILESRATQGIATGLQYPQLQQVSGSGAFVAQDTDGGLNAGDKDFRTADAAFTLGWELDFWGRFRRGVESADAAYFASVANQRDVQVLLAAQVASLYYGYKTTLQRIEIAQQNVALQERSLEITQRLFDEGQDSELDVQQARAQYLGTRAAIPALRLALTQQRNALAALLGRAPGDVPELDAANSALPELQATSLATVPAQLLLRRPDVRSAAWQAAAQSAQVGIAQADLYPSISLGGTLSWSGTSLDAVGDVTTLAGGPGLTWNIFNYGRIENNVRVQDARLQQALEAFQASVLGAAREIDDAAARIAQTSESQTILDASLAAAERSLSIATRRYAEGYSDFQRVLDAQAASVTQSDRAVVNRGDHVAAIIDLYRALGGGWQAASIEELISPPLRDTLRERTDWGDLLDAPLPAPPEQGAAP